MALRLQHAILKGKIFGNFAAIRLEGVFPPLTIHSAKNKTESTLRANLGGKKYYTHTHILENIFLRSTK
jgi:hypothetical protein